MGTSQPPHTYGLVELAPTRVDEGWVVTTSHARIDLATTPVAFYSHGWHTFSATDWLPSGHARSVPPARIMEAVADDPAYVHDSRPSGSGVGAVIDVEGEVVLLGALGTDGRVALDAGRLVGTCANEVEWFLARGEREAVFAAYARVLGDRLGRRRTGGLRMWSSWYSFYEDITQQRLRHVLEEVRSWPLDVFQIDDGWQAAVGDWTANDAFSDGMGDLAERIRSAGLRPGLWLAPFITWPSARLAADHPEWLITDADGAPKRVGYNWGDWFYALDLARPEVLDHLEEVIATVRGWGYEVLKLDFLYAGAVPGGRANDTPRELLYRQAVERLRRAAGEDAYLLACGAPSIPSIGVFDAIRTSADVSPYWENPVLSDVVGATSEVGTRGAITTSLHRLWLQEVIATDPDVVYFRSRYNMLDPVQRGWLQDLARVAGFRATSDPPSWLSDAEREELMAYFEADPPVTDLGGFRFRLGDREVDFGWLARRPPTIAQLERS